MGAIELFKGSASTLRGSAPAYQLNATISG